MKMITRMMMMMTTTMMMLIIIIIIRRRRRRRIILIGHTILTLGNRMNILPPTEPNSTNNLREVKVSQHIDAEKCD